MKATAVILIIIIVGGGFYFLNNNSSSVPETTTTSDPNAPAYTLGEVATHNNQSSCWAAIEGRVYDLTKWISEHPGGDKAILSICGKDGSAAFENQHEGDSRPETILATFFIGNLK